MSEATHEDQSFDMYRPKSMSKEDFDGWMSIVDQAFAKYTERDRVRQGLWKDYSARDQFHQVKIKVERILRSLELIEKTGGISEASEQKADLLKEIKEEVPDIINYCVFGVRSL